MATNTEVMLPRKELNQIFVDEIKKILIERRVPFRRISLMLLPDTDEIDKILISMYHTHVECLSEDIKKEIHPNIRVEVICVYKRSQKQRVEKKSPRNLRTLCEEENDSDNE